MSRSWEFGIIDPSEASEKCSILFKVKSKIPNSERGKARILTLPVFIRTARNTHSISRIGI
jgi:hypothetical protein